MPNYIEVTNFSREDVAHLRIGDGPATVSLADAAIEIDRRESDFTIYGPRGQRVFYRDEEIPIVRRGAFVVPSPTGAGSAPPGYPVILNMQAYPNPFNPSVRVFIDVGLGIPVSVSVYDVAGRRVRTLWEGPLPNPAKTVEWDGTDDRGNRAPTGVYFVHAHTGADGRSVKVHLIK